MHDDDCIEKSAGDDGHRQPVPRSVPGCQHRQPVEQMTDKVHITKHGTQAFEWDSDAAQHVEQKFSAPHQVLRCACHIDADVTLGDIFRAVEQESELVRFLEEWSWCNVDGFHSEARRAARKQSDLAYTEIAKYFEWDK